jgi:arylsulfatase A-like enzyme
MVPGFKAEDVLPTLTQRAVDYIVQRADHSEKPFFLYLALPTPHAPLSPAKEWLGKSHLNVYADYVMETDDCIGKVLATLEKNRLATNTLVIFTSDNGCSPVADFPFLLAHGHDPSAGRRGYKADIYDGGHRIPLIVRWPGHIGANARCDVFVCLGDFMATCAELLKAKLPDNAGEDSVSFLPLLLSPTASAGRTVLVESSINGSFGLREGKWKLALCPDSGGWSYPRPGKDSTDGMPRFQLFDVAADPAEKTNVLSHHPEIVQRLGEMMRDYIVNGRSTPGAPQKNTPVKSWQQTKWLEEFGKVQR